MIPHICFYRNFIASIFFPQYLPFSGLNDIYGRQPLYFHFKLLHTETLNRALRINKHTGYGLVCCKNITVRGEKVVFTLTWIMEYFLLH